MDIIYDESPHLLSQSTGRGKEGKGIGGEELAPFFFPSRLPHPALRREDVFRIAGVFHAETAHHSATLTHEVVAAITSGEEVGILRVPGQGGDLRVRRTFKAAR